MTRSPSYPMSVVLLAVLGVGSAAAEVDEVFGVVRTVCPGLPSPEVCPAGWKRSERPSGGFTCTSGDGTQKCTLCDMAAADRCEETVPNAAMLWPKLHDANGDEVEILSNDFALGGVPVLPVPATIPSRSARRFAGLWDGMRGWSETHYSTLNDFHSTLLGLAATIPSFYTSKDSRITYDCKPSSLGSLEQPNFAGCNIYFFLYRCPPCESQETDIGSLLLSSDDAEWTAVSCGPTFRVFEVKPMQQTSDHQFATYVAEIPKDTQVSVVLDGLTVASFYAMVGKTVMCSDKLTETDCAGVPNNCVWTNDSCIPNVCDAPPSVQPQGPWQSRCEKCLVQDSIFYPALQP
ncbi:hypothetical protein DIPPA_03379 [Diplonema papillatum]|nr:hypothetical protein DIPPA_03379 [Diplonema papillatum]